MEATRPRSGSAFPGDPDCAEALELRELRSLSFNRTLANLASNASLYRMDRDTALQTITAAAAQTLDIARVGVWFFDGTGTALTCADLFDRTTGRHAAGLRLAAADYPDYFSALERWELIAAADALRDPATRCFATSYLEPLGIGAMLDVPVRSAGRVVGVICHEHVGPARPWNAAEQSFAAAIGGCVSLVLEGQARREAEAALHAVNDRLHDIIEFLPDATFVIDAAGVVTSWNRAMEQLTGVPKAEMLGRGDHEYALPLYGGRRPTLIDFALRPGTAPGALYTKYAIAQDAVLGEAFVPRLNAGRGAHLWGSARRLCDAAGRVIGAIESIRDVTARHRAEEEIAAWKKRYELIAAASGQITYEHDLASGAILWSESFDQVLGYSLAELGRNTLRWLRLVHREDRRRVAAELHRSIRHRTAFDHEYRLWHSDGSYRWFRDRGFHVGPAGRPACLVGMLTDITAAKQTADALRRAHATLEERVRERTAELATANDRLRTEAAERERAQQALDANVQKYRLMIDSLPQVVYELDLHGNIVVLNREGVRTARFGPHETPYGVNLFTLVHPDDRERLRANWARLLAGHSINGEEYRFLRRDGTTFLGASYSHIILRDGRPIGVTGVLIDETRRKQVEETLRRAQADLEERVAQRTAELAATNATLRRMLEKQEMNVGLAHQVLLLVNAAQPRNTALRDGHLLFTAAQSIPRHLDGGDHFFVRQLQHPAAPRTLVSLKDQSGHEVGCILRSIITDLIHNALVGPPGAHPPLAEVVTQLNREICRSHLFQDGDFFTAINLEIDHATLAMEYVIAGHPPFLLVRGGEVSLLPELAGPGTNLPIGMLDHHRFTAATVQLQPGDRLILYTDGLLETPLPRGRPVLSSGDLAEAVRRLLACQPDLHAVPLAQALFRTVAGCGCHEAATAHALPDDVALLVIEIERPGPVFEDRFRPATLAELHAARAELATKVAAEWERHRVSASPMRLHTVLEEALYNAWRHGNRGNPAKEIVVRRRYGNDACLEIIDQGDGFAPDEVGDPTAHENRTKPSGRGLFLIRRFADEARWSDHGRQLTLYFGDEKIFCPPAGRSPFPRLDLWNASHVTPSRYPHHEYKRPPR
ncbi:MAG: PAS domain S-box protein [Opitutaceae bacterium]